MNFLFAFFILSVPFSYIEIYDVRVIFLQVVIGAIIFLVGLKNSSKIYLTHEALILILFSCLIFSYSLLSNNFRVFFAAFVFSFLFFIVIQFSGSFVERTISLYKFGVLFSAIGVLTQVSIFIIFGIDVFKVQKFGGGRDAFGFIWEDYSFFSLYLASAIPLFFNKKFDFKFLFFSLMLLLASISTSARTGLVSLLLFIVAIIFISVVRIFLHGKVKRKLLFFVLTAIFIPFAAVISLEKITGRVASFYSSGRIDDFVLGYDYFLKSPFFGVFFNDEFYIDHISTVPHNLFIYTLYLGGVLALLLLFVLLLVFLFKMKRMDPRVSASLSICFIGLQFIPSFFSAYFVAILMGIGVLSSKNRICKN